MAPPRRTPWYQTLWEHNALPIAVSACILIWLLYPTKAAAAYSQESHGSQQPLSCDPHGPIKSVAIVGAGSAGASAAYYINKFKHPCERVNITVYERSSYIGGRSTTVNVHGDPVEPVELGASIFVEVNKNLVSAASEFGLATKGAEENELPKTLGVYDGLHWVFRGTESGWWTVGKLLWKYGLAPIRTQMLVKQIVGSFLKLYEEPYFPFQDLSQTAYDLGLTEATAATGEELLQKNSIRPPFSTDIIQASTRVNYAQNIDKIHGLETMVCMSTNGAMQIRGGNWQIFAGMLKASGARVLLNTNVTSINRQSDGLYAVDASSATSAMQRLYDTVILAAPLQYADILLEPAPVNPPPTIPYVNLHVTLFTSPMTLNPEAFHLGPTDLVPSAVLTTTSNSHKLPLPFFSISTLRTVISPKTGQKEYLYKIFSPDPVEDDFLEAILLTPPKEEKLITWLFEKVWHSYPYLPPRVTFEDIQLDKEGKVWYTSGIESFISTMETSSLMGMNVARLVVDGWADATDSGKEEIKETPSIAKIAEEL